MGCWVWCEGYGVRDVGCGAGVWDLGLGVEGLGFGVWVWSLGWEFMTCSLVSMGSKFYIETYLILMSDGWGSCSYKATPWLENQSQP